MCEHIILTIVFLLFKFRLGLSKDNRSSLILEIQLLSLQIVPLPPTHSHPPLPSSVVSI